MFQMQKVKENIFYLILFYCLSISINEALSTPLYDTHINKLHNALIQNNSSKDERKERVKNLKRTLSGIFDNQKMIKMIYGSKWKALNQESKDELSDVFLDYMTYNYEKRFRKIDNLNFKFVDEDKLNENYVLVKTNLITSENPVEISYILEKKKGTWNIIDILLIGSISEIATKKSEFMAIIEEGGPDGLILAIKSKIIF